MPNPVRIYVLHHPDSKEAEELTNRIYEWFRLPSLEGIPVYVRSAPLDAANQPHQLPKEWSKDWPLPPYGMWHQERVLEYLVPLVDAHMVRDPRWHDYLSALAMGCNRSMSREPGSYRGFLFPVSLDSTAFNLPPSITRWNFIRHSAGPKPGADGEEAQKEIYIEETLKHLTEALARNLEAQVFPVESPEAARFKVFISYARADGTDIAKTLRNYIQGETQCLAFLDENDIGYGQAFADTLARSVGTRPKGRTAAKQLLHVKNDGLSRAMIVVHSDHYADRSWCRWEIQRFTQPRWARDQSPRGRKQPRPIHVFDPLLVVDAMNGARLTRVVPELGQSPLVRWKEDRARFCFSTLMREVVMGLRDVRVAQQMFDRERNPRKVIFVNRLPGPVAVERLLRGSGSAARVGQRTIRYPGNGMSLIELRLLRQTFPNIRFRAFQDLDEQLQGLSAMRAALDAVESGRTAKRPLQGKAILVATSYYQPDLAKVGILQQHQDETLFHLLRPLLRLGADLLYGGHPPTAAVPSPSATRNITAALLRLVSEERPEEQVEVDAHNLDRPRGSLLFNVCAWPRYAGVTAKDEAAWINTYRILRFEPKLAGLDPWPHAIPAESQDPPPGYLRYVARTTSTIRSQFKAGYIFRLPREGECRVQPAAFVFMGGRLTDFSGIMPGIMEEFLHAAETERPIYLFGGLGGAAGVIARAICAEKGTAKPDEFTAEHYARQVARRKHDNYAALLKELVQDAFDPQEQFDKLWTMIETKRSGSLDDLFHNGLSEDENRRLITTENTVEAVQLAWKGMCATLL